MERGYLIAVLAILVTFTGLSHGFRSLEQWSLLHLRHIDSQAKAECHRNDAARAIAKLKTHLRPRYAQEAQLLAEMNVPMADAQSTIAEQMARQDADVGRCARARAMQEAERARRDVLRMQRDMGRASERVRIDPLSLQIDLPPDFEKRIEQSSAMAAKMAVRQVKLQIFANQPDAATKKSTGPQQ